MWRQTFGPDLWRQVEKEAMLSVNKVILIGILADDPVIRDIDGDRMVVGLSVVTMRHPSDVTGNHLKSKEWHRIVITDPELAVYAEAHLAKGEQIYIEGELHTMFWRDEMFDWQSLTRIVLWQDSHRLTCVADGDCLEPAGTPDMLKVAQEAGLFDTLGHVA